MLLGKACWALLLVALLNGSVAKGNGDIDLQELLKDVSSILKSVTSTLQSYSSSMKDVPSTLKDVSTILEGFASKMKDVRSATETCGSTQKPSARSKPRDCADIWDSGVRRNGVQRIWPQGFEAFGSFEVYCDMTTDGGGWTIFQKRGDYGNPEDYFYKTWSEYKTGFGKLGKEFWLGNDRIFALTNQDAYEVRVDLWDMDSVHVHAKYSRFWLENEDQQYMLKIANYSGNAGNDLGAWSGVKFSTKDRKNDHRAPGITSCTEQFKGAWWYTNCHVSNLNGLNLRGTHKTYADGIEWKSFRGHNYSLAATEMKTRPADFYTRF